MFNVNIEIHQGIDPKELHELFGMIHAKLDIIINTQGEIMGKQDDAAQALETAAASNATMVTQLGKVGTEVTALQTKIAELIAAAADNDTVSPRLQAAVDGITASAAALQAAVQGVDDLDPDAPEAPPVDPNAPAQ